MSALVLDVPGHPAPQGSKKPAIPGRPPLEANKRTAPWRKTVAAAVRVAAAGHPPFAGPVIIGALFTMPPTKKAAHELRMGRRCFPDTKFAGSGDEDKLVRAVCDALTSAGAWGDDAQVVRHFAGTDWPGSPGFMTVPGVRLIVRQITGDYLADIVTAWWEDVLDADAPAAAEPVAHGIVA